MASSTPGIPLIPLPPPSTSASASTVASDEHLSSASTEVVILAPSSGDTGTPTWVPTNDSTSNLSSGPAPRSSQSPVMTSTDDPESTPTLHVTRRHIILVVTVGIKTCIAVFGLSAAWLTFKLAVWTSAKDWVQYCSAQNQTHYVVPKNCEDALDKELSPPPGLSWAWLKSHQSKRWLQSTPQRHITGMQAVEDFAPVIRVVAWALAILTGVLLMLLLMKFLQWTAPAYCLVISRNEDTNRPLDIENSTWVHETMVRGVPSTALDFEAGGSTTSRQSKQLRQPKSRWRRNQKSAVPVHQGEESEWLPTPYSLAATELSEGPLNLTCLAARSSDEHFTISAKDGIGRKPSVVDSSNLALKQSKPFSRFGPSSRDGLPFHCKLCGVALSGLYKERAPWRPEESRSYCDECRNLRLNLNKSLADLSVELCADNFLKRSGLQNPVFTVQD